MIPQKISEVISLTPLGLNPASIPPVSPGAIRIIARWAIFVYMC